MFPLLSLSNTVPAAPAQAKPFDALQDSQLFDAENSEPLLSSGGGFSSGQNRPRNSRNAEVKAAPASPKGWLNGGLELLSLLSLHSRHCSGRFWETVCCKDFFDFQSQFVINVCVYSVE